MLSKIGERRVREALDAHAYRYWLEDTGCGALANSAIESDVKAQKALRRYVASMEEKAFRLAGLEK